MKKIIKILSAIIFIVILFANVSNANTNDAEVIEKILEKATYGNVKKTVGEGYNITAVDVPVIIITKSMIEETKAETGYDGDIAFVDGEIILNDSSQGRREYTPSLGNNSMNALEADSSENEEGDVLAVVSYYYSFNITDEDVSNAYNRATGEGLDSDEEIYTITFAGAALLGNEELLTKEYIATDLDGTTIKNEWNDSLSWGNIGGSGTVYVNDKDGSSVASTSVFVDSNGKTTQKSTPQNNTPQSTTNVIDIEVNKGESSDIKLPAESNGETGKRRIYFNNDKSGYYVLTLTDEYGAYIDDFAVYDSSGKRAYIHVSENGTFGVKLEEGQQYYIELPDNKEYNLKIEHLDVDYNNIPLHEAVEAYDESKGYSRSGNFSMAEFIEKILAWFVVSMGEGLNKLISIAVGGYKITIDAIVFDQYPGITLSLFPRDLKYITSNPLLEGVTNPLNEVFKLFRNIALMMYMIILVYVGIRIALMSTSAAKKAKYKELIFDWIRGLIIIFFFPYIIRFTILLNHAFVTYLYDNSAKIGLDIQGKGAAVDDVEKYADEGNSNYMNTMYRKAKDELLLAYAICWFVMLIQIVQFLIIYMKRLITVVFLIAIFPLVSISYAIDKIGDGKSQAFNKWCKDFILQVFVQSFHALNYVLVMGIVFKIDNFFLMIIGITYISKGGDILRSLFAQMSGGSGEGGPLSAAKALIKTEVAIGAVKSLGKVASRTIGSQSVLGKGITKALDNHNIAIERKAVREERATNAFYRSVGFNPNGTMKPTSQMDDETAKNKMNRVMGNTNIPITDEEFKKDVDALSKLSPEQLQRVATSMGMTPQKMSELETVLTHSAAFGIIANRKNAKNVDIQTSVELILKDRTKYGTSQSNSMLDRYMDTTRSEYSDARLRKIAGAHSITVDDSRNPSRAPKGPMAYSNDKNEQIKRAKDSMRAIRNASRGEYTREELRQHYNVVMSIKGGTDADLKNVIAEESKDMNYSLEDFALNLDVQTINASNRAEVASDATARQELDEAISRVKRANADNRNREILNGLSIKENINDLKEGYLPTVIDKSEKSRIQKEIEKQIEENPFSVDRGEEYDNYLANKEAELTSQLRKGRAASAAMIVGGATLSKTVFATEFVAASMMAGNTAGEKKGENPVEKVLTTVSGSVSAVDKIAEKTENFVSAPIKIVTNKLADKDKVSLDVNHSSIEMNRKHYESDAKLNEVNRRLSDAELERQRLLDRINKKAGHTPNGKK